MFTRPIKGYAQWSAALVLVALAGCGSNEYRTVPVTGRVTCDGKPAWGGTVVFEPLDASAKTGRAGGNPGRNAAGLVQEDGSFSLTTMAAAGGKDEIGAVTGPHRVSFLLPKSTPWKWNPEDDWLPEEDKKKLKAELEQRPVYPKLSCGPAVSPGEVEVAADGENHFEFTLGSK